MASVTMTSSLLPSSVKLPSPITAGRRGTLTVVKASIGNTESEERRSKEEGNSKGRRDMVFAAASAAMVAACSMASVAMADEPKRGSDEAKKKYGPICVTMPTARICRN